MNPYLNFNGNCREAMNYYKECFAGNLTLQTVGESPMASQMPSTAKDSILHSMLIAPGVVIMGSDMFWGEFANGNTYHLSVNCDSEQEVNKLYTKFSKDGRVTQALSQMPWGAMYGSLIDKFGKSWFFNYTKNNLPDK